MAARSSARSLRSHSIAAAAAAARARFYFSNLRNETAMCVSLACTRGTPIASASIVNTTNDIILCIHMTRHTRQTIHNTTQYHVITTCVNAVRESTLSLRTRHVSTAIAAANIDGNYTHAHTSAHVSSTSRIFKSTLLVVAVRGGVRM